jgi:hypothetical protein
MISSPRSWNGLRSARSVAPPIADAIRSSLLSLDLPPSNSMNYSKTLMA